MKGRADFLLAATAALPLVMISVRAADPMVLNSTENAGDINPREGLMPFSFSPSRKADEVRFVVATATSALDAKSKLSVARGVR